MSTSLLNPFLYYSNQLQALLVKASKEKNPSMWLYLNNARTPLFMLEALTRLHSKAYDEKLFSKWNKRFKKMEDALGTIDYFVAFDKEFKANKNISSEIKTSTQQQIASSTEKFNKYLESKDWFNGKLLRFNVKLSKYTMLFDEEYSNDLTEVIDKELKSIFDFGLKLNYHFTQMEEEVHEFRRKIRWISIYAQALNGIIQLKTNAKKPNYSINYHTKEIISSPYNKLPKKPSIVKHPILFDKNSFYCLSWMINELGKLKDRGLKIEFLTHEIAKAENCSEMDAQTKAIKILNIEPNTNELILKEVSNIIYLFLAKDKILNSLIVK